MAFLLTVQMDHYTVHSCKIHEELYFLTVFCLMSNAKLKQAVRHAAM